MKGKNWREYEPPKRRRRRRRKGGLLRKLRFAVVLFLVGYVGFLVYYNFGKPYTVALDAGHGGADVGAEGVIQEVALTEQRCKPFWRRTDASAWCCPVRQARAQPSPSVTINSAADTPI